MTEHVLVTTMQVDLSEHGETWTIVCAGPSLDHADVESLADPVIAVDGAAAHPRLRYRFLASWSRHRAVHNHARLTAKERRPAVLTNWNNRVNWAAWLTSHASRPELPLDPFVIGERSIDVPSFWRVHRLDGGPSWLLALRVAVERGGAKEVRLVGMDLGGEGYGLGLHDWRRRSPDEWAGRWRGERRMLARAIVALRGRGVRVRREKPEKGYLRAGN